MKYLFGIVLLLFISCGNNEEVLLPKADRTIVKEVIDLSPIYVFFKVNGKDTLADVNRKNSISTTNWILNIDKRLPLRLVIPEVMKLQEKKREASMHKNEAAENYYSYADSIGKNLAFIPFTNVYYKTKKPASGIIIYFTKGDSVFVNNISVKKTDLAVYLKNITNDSPNKFLISFDKNSSYGNYIQNKIFIQGLEGISFDKNQEFIF